MSVSIEIKKGLDYQEVNNFENLKRDIFAIKIKLKNTLINLIAWYMQPDNNKNKLTNNIPVELLDELEKLKLFVLCGGFNSHGKRWYCEKNSPKGLILEN